MSKARIPDSYALIGEGDDVISQWHEGFDVVEDLAAYVREAEEKNIQIDWTSLTEGLPGLESIAAEEQFEFTTASDFLEATGYVIVQREFWDGGAPGYNGFSLTCSIQRSKRKKILDSLQSLAGELVCLIDGDENE